MKKYISIVTFLFASIIGTAQQFYVEDGLTITSFDYKNSQGESFDNLHATSHSIMEVGFRKEIFSKKIIGSFGFSYSGLGAVGSDRILENFIEWDMNFIGVNVGLEYFLFDINKFKFHLRGSTSADFLTQGIQTINNQVYDLKSNSDFNNVLVDFRLGLVLIRPVTDNIAINVKYSYGKSMDFSSNTEQLKIIRKNLSLGLFIGLSKNKKKEKGNDSN